MIDRLLSAISDIPVIVQGALGSALFSLILYVGQRVSSSVKCKVTSHSQRRRKAYLIEERIKYNVLVAENYDERAAYVSLLLYRASRNLVKALIWLTLGLMTGSLIWVLGVVGYVGALYYLFNALTTVTGPAATDDYEKRLEEISAEIERLEKTQPGGAGNAT